LTAVSLCGTDAGCVGGHQEGLYQTIDVTSRQNNEILLEAPVEYLTKALKSVLADATSELLLMRLDNLPMLRVSAMVRLGVDAGVGVGSGAVAHQTRRAVPTSPPGSRRTCR
jgi:hypothetical protein